MTSNSIEYNIIFNTVKENDKWFLSERKNKKNMPIFDLSEKNWCSIETSKNKDWFIVFYKSSLNNDIIYRKSFAKIEKCKYVYKFFFDRFSEIKKNSDGKWTKKNNEK